MARAMTRSAGGFRTVPPPARVIGLERLRPLRSSEARSEAPKKPRIEAQSEAQSEVRSTWSRSRFAKYKEHRGLFWDLFFMFWFFADIVI